MVTIVVISTSIGSALAIIPMTKITMIKIPQIHVAAKEITGCIPNG